MSFLATEHEESPAEALWGSWSQVALYAAVWLGVAGAIALWPVPLGAWLAGPDQTALAQTPPAWQIVLWAAGFAALLAAWRYPWLAAPVYLSLLYGVARFVPEFNLTLARTVPLGVALLGLAALGAARGRGTGLLAAWRSPLVLVAVALAAWYALCAWAGTAETAWPPPLKRHPLWLVEALALLLLAAAAVRGPRELALAAGALGVALIVRAYAFPDQWRGDGDLGLLAAMTAAVLLGCAGAMRPLGLQGILLAEAGYLVWVLFETRNRGAGLGLLAAGLVLGLGGLRLVGLRARIVAIAVAGCALLAGGAWFATTDFGQRFLNLAQADSADRGSADARLELWRASRGMIADHPWLGVGPGNFALQVGRYTDDPALAGYVAHSNWVTMLAETGWPGLVLWTALFALALGLAVWRAVAAESTAEFWLALGCAASLTAYLVAGSFMTRHDLALAYLLAGSVVALTRRPKGSDVQASVAAKLSTGGATVPRVATSAGRPSATVNGTAPARSAELGRAPGHLAGLDGLRALACLAVFLVHFHQLSKVEANLGPIQLGRFMENGNTGVAVFFLLSGFGLSLPLWSGQLERDPVGWLGKFFRRRVLRIVPAYYLCLTVLVVLQRKWQSGEGQLDTALHYLFAHTFREDTFYSINNPFWTIGIQAQFYLVLPVLLLGAGLALRGRAARLALWTGLSVGSYALHWMVMEHGDAWLTARGCTALVSAHPTVFSHSLLAHLPVFLLGIVAAGLVGPLAQRGRASRGALAEGLFWISAVLVLATIATPLDDRLQVPHGRYNWPFVPILIGVMILLVPHAERARRLMEWAPLRWLGVISFGVYLFHLPCQKLVARLLERAGSSASEQWLVFGLASLALSIAAAAASYWLWERPLLGWLGGRSPAGEAIGAARGAEATP